jgi:hypothetical protein
MRGRFAEVLVQPAQGTASQETIRSDRREARSAAQARRESVSSSRLTDPGVRRAQAEMRRDQRAAARQPQSIHASIAPRGSRRATSSVDLGYRDDRKAREQAIAEVAIGAAIRSVRLSHETGLALQVGEHVETARAQFEFLQGDDVGVDLGEHARDAIGREAPVDADCAVRVVRNDDALLRMRPRSRVRTGAAQAPVDRR